MPAFSFNLRLTLTSLGSSFLWMNFDFFWRKAKIPKRIYLQEDIHDIENLFFPIQTSSGSSGRLILGGILKVKGQVKSNVFLKPKIYK